MWYDICSVYDGVPVLMTPCDDLDMALDVAEQLAASGHTEIVICVRRN